MSGSSKFNTNLEETLKGADIKLILVDFDDTLFVDNETKVSEENIEAIRLCIEKGYMFGVCTGRSKVGILSSFGEDNLKKMNFYGTPGVYMNGTIVYDKIGYILQDETIETNVYAELIDYLSRNNLIDKAFFHRGESNYATENNKHINYMKDKYNENLSIVVKRNELLKYRTMNKIRIVLDTSEYKTVLKSISKFNQKLTIFAANSEFIEVTKLDNDKYSGINFLLKHYNVSDDQVLVIGYSNNDVSMLSHFKYSFAIANSTESAKSSAKCVIPLTNKENAVAYLLKKVFELKKN